MGLITDVKLRQPAENELVGRQVPGRGDRRGLRGHDRDPRARPQGQGAGHRLGAVRGGGFGIGEFSTHVRLDDPPRAGTRLTVQVFGDNPGLPDKGPSPGFDLQENEVIVFPQMQGWLLYRVVSGDTLSAS